MDKQAKVSDVFGRVIPKLTDRELDRLLWFGEGMAFRVQQEQAAQLPAPPVSPGPRPGA